MKNTSLSYNTLKNKQAMRRRSLFWVKALAVFVVLVLVGLVGWPKYNQIAQKRAAKGAVQTLINEGSYGAIEPRVTGDFLGTSTEASFDAASATLTDIKGARVRVDGVTSDGSVYGVIQNDPKDSQQSFNYSFTATVVRDGAGYKVASITTDYGKDSVLSPTIEYLETDQAASDKAKQQLGY